MDLATMRNTVLDNMPYDTGFMFANGANFTQTNSFLITKYDTERVPYIIYNEEGTIYTKKNQYFISRKTVGALMLNDMGVKDTGLTTRIKERASNILLSQGVIDKLKGGM